MEVGAYVYKVFLKLYPTLPVLLLFIYFAQNKRTVNFQRIKKAGTARIKTLTAVR